ncbi:asparagine synthase [Candidatus Woesearchaeota archaeon]|jgi:asparagine synthetase B (glutamine-hydrolysing)|nr:asparagine synthase [Candidatus Woesearchaeota archaeon]
MKINPFCLSSFLTFRHVVKTDEFWTKNIKPNFFNFNSANNKIAVKTSEDILTALKKIISENIAPDTGILLSGGIDSAILAKLVPKTVKAYTIKFIAENAIDEIELATKYAKECGLNHKIIEVTKEDYFGSRLTRLMLNKVAPLTGVEVALFKASSEAKKDGVKTLIVGCSADGLFGGLDKMLSRDWKTKEFQDWFTFVDPKKVLKNSVDLSNFFTNCATNGNFDAQEFIKQIFGKDTTLAFQNGITSAGVDIFAPYAHLNLGIELDLSRIRAGESKYLIREVFKTLYPGWEIPEKIAFARPMDQWLKDWKGPTRPEFRTDFDINKFSGKEKWLMFCLEKFLDLIDQGFFDILETTEMTNPEKF